MTFSQSKNPLHFVELQGLLLRSLEPITCPYPEPDISSSHFPILFLQGLFQCFLPSLPRSFKWSLSFMFSINSPTCTFSSMPLTSHPHLHITKHKNYIFYSPLNDFTDLCFPLSNRILFTP